MIMTGGAMTDGAVAGIDNHCLPVRSARLPRHPLESCACGMRTVDQRTSASRFCPWVSWRAANLLAMTLVALVFALPLPAGARDTITWMEVDMPPFLIQEGIDRNQGYGDVVSAILRQRLPEYDHQKMVTNAIRRFSAFEKGEHVCMVGLYRTPEREAFMHFSIPTFLTMPAALIVRKDKLARFGGGPRISLDAVLGNPDLAIGFSKDRSYGTSVDTVLKAHGHRENLLLFTGQKLPPNFFAMLMRDRLDGLIGLPDEALYQAEQLGLREQLATLLIEENQQGYEGWMCAVGCAKTEWGKAVIDKINAILIQERPSERYRQAYERWLDANSKQRYRHLYQQVFLRTIP